jgi:hypothetical protein
VAGGVHGQRCDRKAGSGGEPLGDFLAMTVRTRSPKVAVINAVHRRSRVAHGNVQERGVGDLVYWTLQTYQNIMHVQTLVRCRVVLVWKHEFRNDLTSHWIVGMSAMLFVCNVSNIRSLGYNHLCVIDEHRCGITNSTIVKSGWNLI